MKESMIVSNSGAAAAKKDATRTHRFAVVGGDEHAHIATSTNPREPKDSITVVGIGADGFDELGYKAQTVLRRADVVIGSWRQLNLLPDTVHGERRPWPSPMLPALEGLFKDLSGLHVAVLASGDPMFHGVGATLKRVLGEQRIHVIPAPSSVSLACARLGWALDKTPVASLVTRPVETLIPLIDSGVRFLVMGRDEFSAPDIAALLNSMGHHYVELTVLSDLGSVDEEISHGTAQQPPRPVSALNVIAVSPPPGNAMKKRSLLPGLDQNTYETDTDSLDPDLRALTVSALAPVPGELLWDIGSGDGSIAIEWLRAIALASGGLTRTRAQAICFEAEPERVVNINRNANKLGVPWLKILGAAPKALKDARYATDPTAVAPDAIYLGAGLDQDMVMETAWSLLRPGGRMVVNARDTTGTKRLRVLQQQYGGTLRHIEITNDSDTVTVTQWRVHKPLVPTGV